MEPYLPVIRESGGTSGLTGAALLERPGRAAGGPEGQGFLFLLDRLMQPRAPSPRPDGRAPEEPPAPSWPLPPESANPQEPPLSERTEAIPAGPPESAAEDEDPSEPGPSPEEATGMVPPPSLPWIYAASLAFPTSGSPPPSEARTEVNGSPASLPLESPQRAGRAPAFAGNPFVPEGGQSVDAELPAGAGPAPDRERSAAVALPSEAGIRKEGDGGTAAIREPKGVSRPPEGGRGWLRLEPELLGEIRGEVPGEQDRSQAQGAKEWGPNNISRHSGESRNPATHRISWSPAPAPDSDPGPAPDPDPGFAGMTEGESNSVATPEEEGVQSGRFGTPPTREESPLEAPQGTASRRAPATDQPPGRESREDPHIRSPHARHSPRPMETAPGEPPVPQKETGNGEGPEGRATRPGGRTPTSRAASEPARPFPPAVDRSSPRGTADGKASLAGHADARSPASGPGVASGHPTMEGSQSVDAELPAGEGLTSDREQSAAVSLPSEAGIQKEENGRPAAPSERIQSVLDALKAVSQAWRGEPLSPGMVPQAHGQPDPRDLLPQGSEAVRLGSWEPLPEGDGPPAAILDPEEISLQPEKGRVWLKLEPERLGEIRGEIALEQDRLQARFFTESPLAKEALEGSLEQLKQALREQGLRLEQFSVTVEPDGRHALHDGLASFRHSGGEGGRGRQEAGQQEEGEIPRTSRSAREASERSRVDLFA